MNKQKMTRQRPSTSMNQSFFDYSYTDDSDNSYTIEDISVVLDSPDVSRRSEMTPKTPNSVRRTRIKYSGSGRRHLQTTANDSSIFCDITPLPTRRPLKKEIISERVQSTDDSRVPESTPKTPNSVRRARIKYGGSGRRHLQTTANDSSIFCEITPLPRRKAFIEERISDSIISVDEDISYDDTFLQEKKFKPDVASDVNTEMFRRFSPRRVAVKLLPTTSRVHKRSGVTKSRPPQKKPNGLLKFLFLGKHGCLNKVLD